MTAIAATHEDRATAFAAAVRERLSDLPADELDDLLDGLQADLAERLADGGELGDADAYAEELRQAAGLPARGETSAQKPRRGLRVAVRESWAAAGERFAAFWAASPSRRAIRDFVLVLRPLWWVARGVVLAWVTIAVFAPLFGMWWISSSFAALFGTLPGFLFLAACVVVSVQWGRGAWAPKRWLVWVRRAASVVAVIALIPALGMAWDRFVSGSDTYVETAYPSGLTHDGTQIGNIFAYDCSGEPLNGVQLFTRDGEPLTTLEDGNPPWSYDDEGGSYQYVQNPLVTLPNGWDGWNVFPLQQAEQNENTGELGRATETKAPFERVSALGGECPVPGEESGDASGSGESGGSSLPMSDVKAMAEAGGGE